MSSDNPYGGPYPGQPGQGPVPGQGGTPSGQPSAGGPYGYPQQPPAGGPPPGSGYTFGPFAPGSQPGGPQGATTTRLIRSAATARIPTSAAAQPTAQWPSEPVEDQNHHHRRRGRRRSGPRNHRHRPGQPRRSRRHAPTVRAPQSQVADPTQTAAAPPSEPPTSAPPPTTAPAAAKASDAVAGYLKALAAADADAAIAYSAEPLTKGGTLTDSVLAQSNKQAPLRGINVPAVDDENAATVDATYKLGKKSVSESFDVIKSGSDWKLQRVVADLNLAGVRYKGVTLRINGAKVSRDVVSVFPGSYALTTGRKTVSYGSKNTVLVRGPSDLPSTSGIKLSLTKSRHDVGEECGQAELFEVPQAEGGRAQGLPLRPDHRQLQDQHAARSSRPRRGPDPFRKAKVSLVEHPGNGTDQDQRRDERQLHLRTAGRPPARRGQARGGRQRVRGQAERQGDRGWPCRPGQPVAPPRLSTMAG